MSGYTLSTLSRLQAPRILRSDSALLSPGMPFLASFVLLLLFMQFAFRRRLVRQPCVPCVLLLSCYVCIGISSLDACGCGLCAGSSLACSMHFSPGASPSIQYLGRHGKPLCLMAQTSSWSRLATTLQYLHFRWSDLVRQNARAVLCCACLPGQAFCNIASVFGRIQEWVAFCECCLMAMWPGLGSRVVAAAWLCPL